MADIAQRGNRLTKKINYDKAYKQAAANPAIVRDVYNVIARKHSLGAKKKPHSSKEGVTASIERTMRDVGKVFRPERDKKFGGGRTNLLEQLGRVEAEPSNPNRRAEISRVHGELNRGYATGGRVGLKKGGKPWGTGPKPGTIEFLQHTTQTPRKRKAIGGIAKNIPKLLKRLGKEIKDQPLPPQLQKTLDEVKKLQQLQKPKKGLGSGVKPSEMHEIIPKKDRKLYLKEKLANPHKRIGKAAGGWTRVKPTRSRLYEVLGGGEKGKPHSTPEGRQAAGKRLDKRFRKKALDDMHDEAWAGKDAEKGKPHSSKEGRIAGGRQNFKRWAKKAWGAKKGGKADKNWIQKAVNPKHKGYCTPMTKKTCTPARKALARTFKKKAKTGW